VKEIMLPRKKKRSFFTWRGLLIFSVVIFFLLSFLVGWYAYVLYQEHAAIQQDGGIHTVEGLRPLHQEK
jgi:hypothetical protein